MCEKRKFAKTYVNDSIKNWNKIFRHDCIWFIHEL